MLDRNTLLVIVPVAAALLSGSAFADSPSLDGWLAAADEAGPAAQVNVGNSYHSGRMILTEPGRAIETEIPVPKDDVEAMKWWRKGIGKHVSAELTLGDAYHNGWGVPRDDAEALRWWKQEDWHPVAQLEIGDAYHNGWGVTRDDIEAVRWWRKSADQGGWRGILAIANAYRNDWGVQKDNAQEYLWLSLTKQIGCWGEDPQHVKQWQEWERKYPSMIRNALDGEPNRASAALQVLTRAMTPDEIEQGHLLMKEWVQKHCPMNSQLPSSGQHP